MTREELNKEIERFKESEERLESLVPGQLIYEIEPVDPFGGSYFEHEVVSVDLDEQYVNTLDNSLNGIPSRLYSFDLGSEIGLPDFKKNKHN